MRPEIEGAKRVVVKVGSSSLTDARGQLDPARITQLADHHEERCQMIADACRDKPCTAADLVSGRLWLSTSGNLDDRFAAGLAAEEARLWQEAEKSQEPDHLAWLLLL